MCISWFFLSFQLENLSIISDDFSDLTPPPSKTSKAETKSKKTIKEGKTDKKKKKKKLVEDFGDEDGDFKPKKKKSEQ